MNAPRARHVHVVWCDDVRAEIGGKPSLMGVYTHAIAVTALPFELPKLCAFVSVVTSTSKPYKQLRISVIHGTQLRETVVLSAAELKAQSRRVAANSRVIEINLAMLMGPVRFDTEHNSLRVRVEGGHGEEPIESLPLPVVLGSL